MHNKKGLCLSGSKWKAASQIIGSKYAALIKQKAIREENKPMLPTKTEASQAEIYRFTTLQRKAAPSPTFSQLHFHSLAVNSLAAHSKQAMVRVQENTGQHSVPLVCKVDTGAEGNVIPVSISKELCLDSSRDSSGAPSV